jgi:hypothetical protein
MSMSLVQSVGIPPRNSYFSKKIRKMERFCNHMVLLVYAFLNLEFYFYLFQSFLTKTESHYSTLKS